MAVKMSVARNSINLPVTLNDAQFNGKQTYFCEKCDAAVIYNAGSNPERNGRIVTIPHYFKLKKKTIHGENCPFNILAQVKIIARESDKNFLKQFKEGVYELRLLLPEEGQTDVGIKNSQDGVSLESTGGGVTSTYVSSGKLNSYLNTASMVLKLRAFCEAHSEIEDYLRLKFGNSTVFWKNFFFEIGDYKRLYRILAESVDKYPVAVSGKIDAIKEKPSKYVDGKPYWLISIDTQFERPNAEGIVRKASMIVTATDPRLVEDIKVDDEVVIFGKWEADKISSQPELKKESKIKIWENWPMKFRLTHKRQISKL